MDGNAEICEISSRSTQFTKAQSDRLAELVTENYRKLYPSNDVAEGNKLSNQTWQMIATQLNTESLTKKTVGQIKERWNNMKRVAKKKTQAHNK